MTQPVPPDPLLVEIRDLLREIRDAVKAKEVQIAPTAIPMRIGEPPRRPASGRSNS